MCAVCSRVNIYIMCVYVYLCACMFVRVCVRLWVCVCVCVLARIQWCSFSWQTISWKRGSQKTSATTCQKQHLLPWAEETRAETIRNWIVSSTDTDMRLDNSGNWVQNSKFVNSCRTKGGTPIWDDSLAAAKWRMIPSINGNSTKQHSNQRRKEYVYIYIYIMYLYMCVYMYIYVYICTHVHTHTYVYIWINAYICYYIYIHICYTYKRYTTHWPLSHERVRERTA